MCIHINIDIHTLRYTSGCCTAVGASTRSHQSLSILTSIGIKDIIPSNPSLKIIPTSTRIASMAEKCSISQFDE